MGSFAIVTDSAADVPAALAERYHVRVVPLHVVYHGRDYQDGVDITTPELLGLMRGQEDLPVTSQPAPADFLEVYKELFEQGYTEILSIHLSRALSATIESARALAGMIPEGLRLEVVDSCSATVAQGAKVREAAGIAEAGGTLDEALARVEAIRDSYAIHFVPDTLENLVKGGRATKTQGFVTSLLNIKLVIGLLRDGSIDVENKAKGIRGAVSYMARAVAADAEARGPLVYYLLHTDALESALKLKDALERAGVDARMVTEATIGPVIATHVGEGAIGIFTYPAALHAPELDDISTYLTPQF